MSSKRDVEEQFKRITRERHNPNEEELLVYHGTRAPLHELETIGITFPTKEQFLSMIKKVMSYAGLDYNKWLENDIRRTKKGDLTTHWEMEQSYRSKSGIWVTNNEQTAKNYAMRNPEQVWSAVRWAYIDQRRLSFKKAQTAFEVADNIKQFTTQAMDAMGTPKVVTIDAKKIGLSEPIGLNCPTGLRIIPPEAIIDIRELT